MKIHLDSSEPDVRVEIIPLIDVIFCILTFFILTAVTLTRQNAINVDLPRASTGTPQMRKLLLVTVDPIGQTYVEKQPVSRDQLYQALTSFRKTSPEGTMVLYASRAASYNDVVQVLDLLQSVGGDRVALATLPGSGSPGSTLPGANGLPGSSPLPSLDNQGSSLPGLAPDPSSPYNLNPSFPSGLTQPTPLLTAPPQSTGIGPSSAGSGATGTSPIRPSPSTP